MALELFDRDATSHHGREFRPETRTPPSGNSAISCFSFRGPASVPHTCSMFSWPRHSRKGSCLRRCHPPRANFPRSRNASEPFPPHRFRRASHSRRVVGSDTAAGRRNLFGRFGCDDRHYQHETKRTQNSPGHLSTLRLRETQISRKRHSPPFSDLDINYNSRSS